MSVAATYADALYEAAEAQSAVDRVRTELADLAGAMADGTDLRAAGLGAHLGADLLAQLGSERHGRDGGHHHAALRDVHAPGEGLGHVT
ncbi:MAG: F0F1 ATP synthase subunit delta, partial [Actinomycetota bacterium]